MFPFQQVIAASAKPAQRIHLRLVTAGRMPKCLNAWRSTKTPGTLERTPTM